MNQALEALELAKRSYGVVLLSDPPQDAWKIRDVNGKINNAIKALEEALAQPHEMTVREFNQMIEDDPHYHEWLKKRRQNERISP